MALECPYCAHRMTVRGAKPGRYQPKCGKCGQRFLLIVPGGGGAPTVNRIEATPAVEKSSPAVDATVDFTATPTPPAADRGASDPGATGDWSGATGAGQSDATLEHVSAATPTDATAQPAATWGATATALPAKPGRSEAGGELPERIGGYRVLKELGRGAMGAVFLARQLSLDRNVALKTVQAQWTNSPQVMARFTREAYAAAQLTHHNVVQIYDLGNDRGIPYFSMEFVRGQSLADVLQQHGKLEPRAAAGFILQAARGLRFAHQHGMVHRDVKPANLMLDEHGVVKVADLGLVKTPELLDMDDGDSPPGERSSLAAATANVTLMNSAMSTPAFMAPEQVVNAAGVDHRADIYSLGCTLYALLAGRPPFSGATALEVITKQKTEPVPRIETIDASVPRNLADIVMRMVAKQPNQRYHDLDQAIQDLETFLGVGGAERLPGEEHLRELEVSVAEFNASPAARLRGMLAWGSAAGCAVLAVIWLPFNVSISSGFLVMLACGVLAYFVVSGLRERTHLFDKARELAFAARWTDWLTWLFGAMALLLVAFALGWLGVWLAMGVVGVGAAVGFHFILDRRVQRQRQGAIDRGEAMLKTLRLRGVDEAELRRFVAEFGGDQWEAFFEMIFGYPAKLEARAALASGSRRRRYRAWRDPLIRWIDERVRAYREVKDRVHLAKIEQANLRAKGLDAAAAAEQAKQMASALVDQAAESRRTPAPAAVDPRAAAEAKRARIKAALAEARSGEYSKKALTPWLLRGPFGFAFSGKMRFLLGCALLIGCVLWARQNRLLLAEDVRAAATEAMKQDAALNAASELRRDAAQAQPLNAPVIGPLFDSFVPGVAGFVLLALAMFRGWKMSLFALPAAAVMVLGPKLGLPGIEALGGAHATSLALGLTIAAAGLVLGRTKAG